MFILKKYFEKIKILTLLLVFFVISWCGSTFEWKLVDFGHYSIQIWSAFEDKNISIFENKRTKWHIFKAFVFPYMWEWVWEIFEKNIIFGAIDNVQNTDSKTFAEIGRNSIAKTFPWYRQISFLHKDITCKDYDDIDLYIHSFGYTQYNNLSWWYYTTQAYFVDKQLLYTLSASSDVEWDIDIFEQYFKTLECKKEEAQEGE